jgi:hypothetical protein
MSRALSPLWLILSDQAEQLASVRALATRAFRSVAALAP